jgi:hypothetical protein
MAGFKLTDASHKAFAKHINDQSTQDDSDITLMLNDHMSGRIFRDARGDGRLFANVVTLIGKTHLMGEWDSEQVAYGICGLIDEEIAEWNRPEGAL